MWDIVNTLVGWDHLTPQAVRFGIASFLALLALAPGRNSTFEVVANAIFSAAASILVVQAISLGAG
jgi:hypothetical protein